MTQGRVATARLKVASLSLRVRGLGPPQAGHRPTGLDVSLRQGTGGRRGTPTGGYGRARDGRGGRVGAKISVGSFEGPGPGFQGRLCH